MSLFSIIKFENNFFFSLHYSTTNVLSASGVQMKMVQKSVITFNSLTILFSGFAISQFSSAFFVCGRIFNLEFYLTFFCCSRNTFSKLTIWLYVRVDRFSYGSCVCIPLIMQTLFYINLFSVCVSWANHFEFQFTSTQNER